MPAHKPTIGHRLEYTGWVLIATLVRVLPRRAIVALADAAGWALHSILRIRRRLVDEQLALALGSSHETRLHRRQVALRAYQNCVLTFFEFIHPPAGFSNPNDLFAGEPENLENAQPLFGGPVICVTAHIGNWEAMPRLLPHYGIRLVGIAKPLHNPLIQARVLRDRAVHENLEVLLTHASMKTVVDATRTGKWVGIVGDQDARRTGVFVDFFGIPASTAPGAAHFAYRLNLPILPVFCVRDQSPARKLRVLVCPPIRPNPEAEKEAEIHRLTAAHTKALEEVIRTHPADYFWLHRRWKTKPRQA